MGHHWMNMVYSMFLFRSIDSYSFDTSAWLHQKYDYYYSGVKDSGSLFDVSVCSFNICDYHHHHHHQFFVIIDKKRKNFVFFVSLNFFFTCVWYHCRILNSMNAPVPGNVFFSLMQKFCDTTIFYIFIYYRLVFTKNFTQSSSSSSSTASLWSS